VPTDAARDVLRDSASLRAWPIVVLSTGLGSAFHAAAGGRLPGLVALAAMTLLLWIPARFLMARRAPLALVALAVACGQAFVHLFLTATAGHHHAGHTHGAPVASGSTTSASAPGTLADALGAGALPADAIGVDPVALAFHRLAEEMTLDHAAMGLAHAFAGLLVGAWLAFGERAVRTLVALFQAAWALPQRFVAAVRAATFVYTGTVLRPLLADDPPVLVHQHHQATLVLRGPPMTHALVPSSFVLAA
jgi:hypothetical protein